MSSDHPVLLVRHAQSEWNAVRRWQGQADSSLTALGHRQAAAVADALAGMDRRFAAVWSSDLERARQTAAVIADRLRIASVATDPRLREARAGPWQGLTPDEIEQRWPGWLSADRRPEGFEPRHELLRRAVAAVSELIDHSVGLGPIVVVTHSGLIRALRRDLGAPDDRIPNVGGTWIRRATGGELTVTADFAVPDVAEATPSATGGR